MSGGQAVAEMFARHGVGPMWGMGGFQLLPFYDAVRRLGLPHHLVNDERAGVFAADAYARVTGRPGVCDATLGPGATNLVTGLVESLNAGVPLVVLVGEPHRAHAGRHMTQEARQLEILAPAVKAVIRVEVAERIPEHVRRAFALSTSGRAGPVVLALPEDVSHGEVALAEDDLWSDPATLRAPARRTRPAAQDVASAAALLATAERPLVLAGGGVHLSDATEALEALAERHRLPVAHTLSGAGVLRSDNPLSLGLFGRYSRIANELIEASDCLLVVGCKLGEVATRRYALPPAHVPLIHLDILPEEIGHWARTAVGLWGDAREGLLALDAELGDRRPDRAAYLADVAARRDAWAQSTRPRYESDEQPIGMARLIGELNATLPAEAIVVADGGFASHWTGLLYDSRRRGRTFISDRGFASIGYGLPGSIGAATAAPGVPVVGLTGDGGMNMSAGELETARRVGAGVLLIVVNNAASGYVKALQHGVYGAGAYQSSDLSELDYGRIAQAYGCHGRRIEDPADLRGAIEEHLARRDGVPTVLDVVVTRDPSRMLPGVDSRTARFVPGDRPA
ncbi:thiamine pyrophosphate-binding protein [Baekduia soli]|uniref:Thiamine pyrophosphate-binding protein n=2 Tax=Baekduia soli TaxID=496014 RepID=A0A5B8UBS5_9ACTN|nr:thiamine pyrophosphate-binding protein [Baekduia soli]